MTNIEPNSNEKPLARRRQSLPGVLAVALAAAMMLSACGSGSSPGSTPSSPTGANNQMPAVALDESAASLLPAEYKGKTLTVAFETGNLPWSDFTADKSSMQGLDHDLLEAVATVLGVEAKYEGTSFTNIIPGVQGGRYDVGVANIYDKPEREAIVDEVTYGNDGEILIAKKGGKTGLTEDSLCGLKVAASASTVQAEEMPKRSEKCVSEGKQPIEVQVYPSQSEMYLSVSSGRADLLATASSNGGYLVKTNPGAFDQAAPTYANVPIAMVLKKDSPISKAMAAAVNVLIKNGTYAQLLEKWGLGNAAIDESKVNPATTGK